MGTHLEEGYGVNRKRGAVTRDDQGGSLMELVPLLIILALVFVLEGSLGCGFYELERAARGRWLVV
jgi:hypothetical protein